MHRKIGWQHAHTVWGTWSYHCMLGTLWGPPGKECLISSSQAGLDSMQMLSCVATPRADLSAHPTTFQDDRESSMSIQETSMNCIISTILETSSFQVTVLNVKACVSFLSGSSISTFPCLVLHTGYNPQRRSFHFLTLYLWGDTKDKTQEEI